MKTPNDGTEYVSCDCGSHALRIASYLNDKEIHLAFFNYGQCVLHPFKYRLRTIWRILTKGGPYEDMVILSYSEAKKMIKFIEKEMKYEQRKNRKSSRRIRK